jgi:xanthine dehydrogenase accessory factor
MSPSNDYVRISRFLSQGRSMVWIRIIKRDGSAPRDVGASCLLLDGNTLVGSIGGGQLEYEMLEKARRLHPQRGPRVIHYRMTGKEAEDAGMICGGSVDILMDPLFHDDPEVVSFFEATKQHILSGTPGTIVSLVKTSDGDSPKMSARMFVGMDGNAFGSIPGGIPLIDELVSIESPGSVYCPETGREYFIDPLERPPVLLIFGAGHISTCLTPLARKLGFRIIVVDDRAEFANADRFPDVDEIYAIPFERAVKQINTTFATHIVILTRGHTHDRLVLEAMLRKPHAYLGMIGSIKKRDIIYEALLKSGFSPDMLSAVFSPIGLDIGAETPDEIAFSIMAELISIRSRKRKSLTTASTLKDKTPFAVL